MSVMTVIIRYLIIDSENGINLIGYFVQDSCFAMALNDFTFTQVLKYMKRATEVLKKSLKCNVRDARITELHRMYVTVSSFKNTVKNI